MAPMDMEAVWLGAFVGAQVLVVFFCAIKANTYRERALLLHAAATLLGVMAVQSMMGRHALLPHAVFLLMLAIAGAQLLELVSHAGALRKARRWLLGASLVVLPLLAVASIFQPWCLPLGTVLWALVTAMLLRRAWPQSQPWAWWLVPGVGALILGSAALVWEAADAETSMTLVVAALLTIWSACIYLATGWRGRLFGETRARIKARNTIDPLTGLATPLVMEERINASRHMLRRYGHPSVLMLVQIENLQALAAEFGAEAAESAVLAAASRVRDALLRDGDVAARLTHARFAVLAEGVATGEAAANVATRILVAGLKEPLAGTTEFLRFRLVMAGVPTEEVPPRLLLNRLGARLDQELQATSERRIVTVGREELVSHLAELTA
ncbi:GGDEF domain-containing protein [Caenimonas sedimenti]|uniref:GGDEF domain-containing protein n=1 Tax=Caenimonas sedimenti TaxID=2596921 RepID=A0A562ZYF8_9BURK|nr:GGDEF domain-containing protein [Caenimonas sedimenti]TWO73214.1 GGDEF domain-containing protein [Caenimonas sedimenti]